MSGAQDPRPEVVDRLVKAAANGMMRVAAGTTTNEVLSAYFTLCGSGIDYAISRCQNDAELELTRASIQRGLMVLFEKAGGRVH